MKNSKAPIENKTTAKKGKSNIVSASSNAAADLRALFIDNLKDIYWAEKALVNALPKMAKNAKSSILASTIQEHLTQTENQITRLENVFSIIGEKAQGKKCEAMAGLLKEGDSILEETKPGAVRDAGIIVASQKIEHYEIAAYGTLAAFAKTLGENDAAKLLTQTLMEEKEADSLLNNIALNLVNFIAVE